MDGIAFGLGLRALRVRKGWRQEDLAVAAGTSRGVVARIEQGHAGSVTVETLERVARPLGARIACRLMWNGEGLDRLLDARHAATVERVVRILGAAGWSIATEVSFSIYGERGSIDVLAFHPPTRVLLVVEVKSVVPDIQAMLAALGRKVRLGPQIAADQGWRPIAVGRLLAVREDRTARRRVALHAATFETAFPDRAIDVRRWLKAPTAARPLHGLWFLSVESPAVARRRVHRRASTAERGLPSSS